MSDKILFYYNPMSRGRIVHWMLEEVQANYEMKILDWSKMEHKSPEYLKINPMGQIPAIVHKNTVVTEVAAICAYLADAFPNAKMAPAVNDPLRGAYYRWLFFAAGSFEYALFDKTHPRTIEAPATHIGYSTYDLTLSVMEKAISQGYILGNQFSAADVVIASHIGWGIFSKALNPTPAFQDYVRRCEDRPAFRSYMEQAGPMG